MHPIAGPEHVSLHLHASLGLHDEGDIALVHESGHGPGAVHAALGEALAEHGRAAGGGAERRSVRAANGRTCRSRGCRLQTDVHCLLIPTRSSTCQPAMSRPWPANLRSSAVNNENQPMGRMAKSSTVGSLPVASRQRQALAQATNTMRQVSLKGNVVKKAGEGDPKAEAKQRILQPRSKNVINDENAGVLVKSSSSCSSLATSCAGRKSLARVASKPSVLVRPQAIPEQQVEPEEPVISFSHSLIPEDVEDIDENDGNNVLLATDYVNDIYAYLRTLEKRQTICSNFLAVQKEMTPKMRSVLVDWLVNVHYQFKLLPESLYMGVWVMDRFFQAETVSKDKIQLVGVTAFFIASKYEEIYPPDLSDFVAICDALYSKRDILKMEMVILRVLKFELGRPLPLHFLRRNSKAAHADPKIHTLAKYLMELTLLEHTCSHWAPSLLAATALYVTLKVLAESPGASVWSPTLAFFSNYSEQQLLPHAAELCKLISKAEKSRYQNVRKKYAAPKLYAISQLPELDGDYVREMAAIASD